MTDHPSENPVADLEHRGIPVRPDLRGLIDEIFGMGFGYALGGSPWRTQSVHEAGVYRRGGTMTKRTGPTPEIALARALVNALDAEADPPANDAGRR